MYGDKATCYVSIIYFKGKAYYHRSGRMRLTIDTIPQLAGRVENNNETEIFDCCNTIPSGPAQATAANGERKSWQCTPWLLAAATHTHSIAHTQGIVTTIGTVLSLAMEILSQYEWKS